MFFNLSPEYTHCPSFCKFVILLSSYPVTSLATFVYMYSMSEFLLDCLSTLFPHRLLFLLPLSFSPISTFVPNFYLSPLSPPFSRPATFLLNFHLPPQSLLFTPTSMFLPNLYLSPQLPPFSFVSTFLQNLHLFLNFHLSP